MLSDRVSPGAGSAELPAQPRESDQALRASNDLLDRVLANTHLLIAYLDTSFHFVRVNKAYAAADGHEPEFFVGKNYFDLYPNEGNEAIFRRVVESRDPYVATASPLKATENPERGTTHWNWSVQPVIDAHGSVEGLVLGMVDVTEQVQAAEAEREQRTLAEALRDATGAINSTLDLDEVLDRILAGLGRVVHYDAASIHLLDDSAKTGSIIRVQGYAERDLRVPGLKRPYDVAAIPTLQQVLSSQRPVVIPDTHAAADWVAFPETGWVRSHASAPICLDEKVIGFLSLDSAIPGSFVLSDADRLKAFADQAAGALRKARLYEQLRAVTARLAGAEEDERKRLARELHDQVGRNLTVLGINLSMVLSQLRLEPSDTARARLEESLVLVEQTTDSIRNVMDDLRPSVLDDYGLVSALRWYGSQFGSLSAVIVDVRGEEPEPRLPAPAETALFRIAQEALANVAQHARASKVTIIVETADDSVRLVVADDGVGFEPAAIAPIGERRRWGLLSMRERAEAIGGRSWVESSRNGGTRVFAEAPRWR